MCCVEEKFLWFLEFMRGQIFSTFYGLAFQAECYHYLFDAAIKMYQLGIDWTTPEHGPINSAKRLRSVASPGVPNGCHTAKSSKVCSFFPVICEFDLIL